MQGTRGFALVLGEVIAILEPNRADGQIQSQAEADGEFDITGTELIVAPRKCTRVEKSDRLECAAEAADELRIGVPSRLPTRGIIIDRGPKLALGKAAHTARAAVEQSQINRQILTVAGGNQHAYVATKPELIVAIELVVPSALEAGLGVAGGKIAHCGSDFQGALQMPTVRRQYGAVTVVKRLGQAQARLGVDRFPEFGDGQAVLAEVDQ